MRSVIKKTLEYIVEHFDDILLTDDEIIELDNLIHEIFDEKISKYEACRILKISRFKFDDMVLKGLIPRGMHKIGFKELFWDRAAIKHLVTSYDS